MNKLIKGISLIVAFSSILLLNGCEQNQAHVPGWLEGQWETGDSVGLTAESWDMINDQFMTGEGLFIMPEGFTIIEELAIFVRDGELYYAAVVPNQNEGREVIFIATYSSSDSLVFENPTHDFPKKVIYNKKDHDTIEVHVSGGDDSKVNIITLKKI